jgi:hypothetical protein
MDYTTSINSHKLYCSLLRTYNLLISKIKSTCTQGLFPMVFSTKKNVIYLLMSSPDPVDVAANFVKLLLEKNELLSGSNNVVL